MTSGLVRLAAAFGFLGVALGAFGAHGLRDRLSPPMLEIYRTGVLYHLIHALAMLAIALNADRIGRAALVSALLAVGIVVFSGSLYALSVTGQGWLGAITPFGGATLLAAWLVLVISGVGRSG